MGLKDLPKTRRTWPMILSDAVEMFEKYCVKTSLEVYQLFSFSLLLKSNRSYFERETTKFQFSSVSNNCPPATRKFLIIAHVQFRRTVPSMCGIDVSRNSSPRAVDSVSREGGSHLVLLSQGCSWFVPRNFDPIPARAGHSVLGDAVGVIWFFCQGIAVGFF